MHSTTYDPSRRNWTAPVEAEIHHAARGVWTTASVAALSDRGLRRGLNEDAHLVLADAGLVAVADGMGGHACGDLASRSVLRSLELFFDTTGDGDGVTWPAVTGEGGDPEAQRLGSAIRYADHRLKRLGETMPQCRDMGTTIATLLLDGSNAHIAHVGDSRIYRLRERNLEQLTTDHTLLNDPAVAAAEWLTDEEKRRQVGHILTRCLGVRLEAPPEVARSTIELRPMDRYLLCTDGLTDLVSDPEILELLLREDELLVVARTLVDRANQRGGKDNTTVVLIEVSGVLATGRRSD